MIEIGHAAEKAVVGAIQRNCLKGLRRYRRIELTLLLRKQLSSAGDQAFTLYFQCLDAAQ
jgi:hypothetical protein